jgi:hypothetical protein
MQAEAAMPTPTDRDEIHAALNRLGRSQASPELWTRDRRVAALVRRRTGVRMVPVRLDGGSSGWVLVRGERHA